MGVAEQIVEGIAYGLWTHALAGYLHTPSASKEARETYDEIVYGDGEVPAEAMQPAQELANLYTLANGRSLVELYRAKRHHPDSDELPPPAEDTPKNFGYALATMALRTAGSHYVMNEVRFQISYDGDLLHWEGDIDDATVNPARTGARGPVRTGEKSRFRETMRGHGRHTPVVPRARFTTSESGKQTFSLMEMIEANADTPDICDRIRAMRPGQSIKVDSGGGGGVRVKRVT